VSVSISDHSSEAEDPQTWDPVPWPAPLARAGLQGHLDRFGPDLIDGWAMDLERPSDPVDIDLWEDGQVLGRITANLWRTDLQEVRQGDGRWGFTALPPARLADGRTHRVLLTRTDGRTLLAGPIEVRFEPGADRAALPLLRPIPFEPDPPSVPRPRAASGTPDGVLISVIVLFYNMEREAARTLASLSRAYQRHAEQISYEVICIDNGSAIPLQAEWVEGFGPEFRLIRAQYPAPSPVGLINAAARDARGHHLAIMIDGAHVLSPGVLRETADAIAEAPDAIISLRQWFIGGDQRFLARSGWTREQENMLFDRIGWPQDGYGLFRISTPVWESPNHWFDGMSESNCLFVPAELFARIGGFDEAFDEPGAGYANLDLFRRASEGTDEPVIALVGEASFHQFHDGTTTNVDPDEKERRVRAYADKYAHLRGKPWKPLHSGAIRLRGQIHTRTALVARQRPLSPAGIGVTAETRPAELSVHFDKQAKDYLVSVYAEAGLAADAKWRGAALGVAPPDALEIANILHQIRPQRVIAVHLAEGLRRFVSDALEADAIEGRLVTVGESGLGGPAADPLAQDILDAVRRAIGTATDIVVLYGARPQDERLLQGLQAYHQFVSLRSYLVVIGSAAGQPWLGYSRAWTMKAINSFADQHPFDIDLTRTRHFITSCPLGFLQRIGPVEAGAGLGLVGVS
jgi:cephalosporin hydroxylase/glycosyltransferase involved in cell wall biosynthesis